MRSIFLVIHADHNIGEESQDYNFSKFNKKTR